MRFGLAGEARLCTVRRGMSWSGMARQAWHGEARCVKDGSGTAVEDGQGALGSGAVRSGKAS